MTKISGPVSGYTIGTQAQLAAELGGDANAQAAAMMLVHARDKSQNLKETRRAELSNLRSQQQREVDQMRSRADEAFAAARAKAYGKIYDGAASAVGGACLMAVSDETTAKALNQSMSGAGQLGSACTDSVVAGHERDAAAAETASVVAKHRAEESQARLDELRDEQRETQDLTRTAIDFLRDVSSAQQQVDNAVAYLKA